MCRLCESGNLSVREILSIHKEEISCCEVFLKTLAHSTDEDLEELTKDLKTEYEINYASKFYYSNDDVLDEDIIFGEINNELNSSFTKLFRDMEM